MGLGSILGTGVFVSLGIGAGAAGTSVVLAVALAAVVASCNGLSSAQLAAAHPVSGGTYEYGHRWLSAPLGFTAGWMFLCAKSASAATAALGLAGYAMATIGLSRDLRVPIAALAVAVLTVLVAGGIRRSNAANIAIVSVTLASLVAFVIAGSPAALANDDLALDAILPGAERGAPLDGFFEATALMFVAYTGYGRIATLGEEVRDPARTIPRAIVVALLVTMVLYVSVAAVAIGSVGAESFAAATREHAAPLEVVARSFGGAGNAVAFLLAIGAVTAMLGVLLNLLLGLSRVLLAMGRRRDMPAIVARVDEARGTPRIAVIVVGVAIACLVAIGNLKTTWSFSAFTVLVYYAITNLAALRLPRESRRFPRAIPALGLVSCLGLAFWVDRPIWLAGLALIAAGLVWHAVARAIARRRPRG